MANCRILVLGAVSVIACTAGYLLLRPLSPVPTAGVVRATEVHLAPEVAGELAAIKVRKGETVHAGDVIAELSAVELIAAVAQARAAVDAATANRNNVYAGVRAEQVAALAAEIAKSRSRLDYAQAQLARTATLARGAYATQQALDQDTYDVASAQADVAKAEANHAAAVAGPTKEERMIADAQVQTAAAALAVLQRHLGKTVLRSPVDGTIGEVVAEIGENVHAGQPLLTIVAAGEQWLSFNVREDSLHGLTVGAAVRIARAGATQTIPAVVTAMHPLGAFATWQAESAVGDHDRNSLRLRLDPQSDANAFEPGMMVWIAR
jgi:HlyD family secretion protein